MSWQALATVAIIVAAMALFASEKVRIDLVALLVLAALVVLGIVGPADNYSVLTDFQTWVCSTSMLLGRLEIFSVLVLFTPAYWRK
jgi:Trk-type K+ transport system membrane component